MPTCYLTVSDSVAEIKDEKIDELRTIIAECLMTRSRYLDKDHVCVRVIKGTRRHMLGEIEIEVFAQFYLRRFFVRDKKAFEISARTTQLFGYDCATWINMGMVGYSRVTKKGETFFSD